MRHAIRDLEEKLLDPGEFVRVHRSATVNLSHIVAVEPVCRAEYEVILDDGSHVTCSRGYPNPLREPRLLLRVGRSPARLRSHPTEERRCGTSSKRTFHYRQVLSR